MSKLTTALEGEREAFELFYIQNIVENGDGCSILPEEDFIRFLTASHIRVLEVVLGEIGEDEEVPTLEEISAIRGVKEHLLACYERINLMAINTERARLRIFLQEAITNTKQ